MKGKERVVKRKVDNAISCKPRGTKLWAKYYRPPHTWDSYCWGKLGNQPQPHGLWAVELELRIPTCLLHRSGITSSRKAPCSRHQTQYLPLRFRSLPSVSWFLRSKESVYFIFAFITQLRIILNLKVAKEKPKVLVEIFCHAAAMESRCALQNKWSIFSKDTWEQKGKTPISYKGSLFSGNSLIKVSVYTSKIVFFSLEMQV